jgi:peptide-methionine (S)-S-oxide reductase
MRKSRYGFLLLLLVLVVAPSLGCNADSKGETAGTVLSDEGVADMKKATFGAGCFWGVEAAFGKVNGVVSTQVGYIGGKTEDPTYKDVCTDRTGHAEAVEVTYDPDQVPYEDLLKVFWEIHDPTQLNRQGPDFGSQYRSAIFYHDADQERQALASKGQIEASGKYDKEVATEIVPAGKFYRAEEYHQQYLEKRGINTCR